MPFAGTDVDVEILHRFIGRIVERVRVSHAGRRACQTFDQRRAPINGELGFAIQDEQHFFASVVKVMTDATAGLQSATNQEIEIHAQGVVVEQLLIDPRSCAAMGRTGRRLVEIGVRYALRQGLHCAQRANREGARRARNKGQQ